MEREAARKKKRERAPAEDAPPTGAAARVRQQKQHSERVPAAAGDGSASVPQPPHRASEKAAKKAKLLNSVYLPARVLTPADKSALAFER